MSRAQPHGLSYSGRCKCRGIFSLECTGISWMLASHHIKMFITHILTLISWQNFSGYYHWEYLDVKVFKHHKCPWILDDSANDKDASRPTTACSLPDPCSQMLWNTSIVVEIQSFQHTFSSGIYFLLCMICWNYHLWSVAVLSFVLCKVLFMAKP